MADSCAFDTLFARNVPHILEKIFLSLDYKSFKKCLEVSRAWNRLLTSDSFQAKAKLVFRKEIKKECEELWHAAKDGNIGEVQRLLSSWMIDVNYLTIYSCFCRFYRSTPLYMAAIEGHEEVIHLLLHAGANPNMGTSCGRTPLHAAAQVKCQDAKIVQVLLDGGAEPDREDDLRDTPLHVAAINARHYVVKVLLERGADPTKVDRFGKNALALAIEKDHKNEEKIQILTDHFLKRSNQ